MYRFVKTTVAAFAVLAVVTSGFAEEGHEEHAAGTAHKGMTMPGDKSDMPEMCRQMMQDREQMMKQMTEMDKAIEERLAAAKKARGDARVEGLTEVVEALVSRHKAMRETMMGSMPQMMNHMMAHMQKGGMMGGEGMSMADCPMMKGMMEGGTETEGSSEGGHSEHH